jgi:uncharacterized protein YyaL (SSP411 family)
MRIEPCCGFQIVSLVLVSLLAVTGMARLQSAGTAPTRIEDMVAAGAQPEQAQPRHTNRLAQSTSPYLLQHAHNPVDWYPWGPEALERARTKDKPIFLSVGYSTCYWCHVMEREVFENEEIARLMNERFICIKVDREERPDLDEIYMMATQLMTQHGGWPNSVFLTPDLKPFFAGTYFGPKDQPGRPGFGTLVTQLGEAWKTQRDKIDEVSGRAADAIRSILGERLASIPAATLDGALVDAAVRQIAASHDPRDGGFGLPPKFPSDFYYSFLLDVHERREAAGQADDQTLAMVTRTLDAMAAGGTHDHVGGGFHRYSTDGQWKVPHFEKMLYNQAHLAVAYLDACAATGEVRFADTARGIFSFVAAVFTGPDGQFYSALDAETDAVEGAYYVWTRDEITRVLGDKDAAAFLAVFALANVPHFPGHKHPEGGAVVRKARGVANSPEIEAMLGKLASARQNRTLPRLDDKAIAAWNGMMIDAYARGSEVLKEDSYRAAAAKAATFVLDRMRTRDGRLLRSVRVVADAKRQPPSQEGFLEDYAFVIRGLLALERVETDSASKTRWLAAARTLAVKADELIWDKVSGGCGRRATTTTPSSPTTGSTSRPARSSTRTATATWATRRSSGRSTTPAGASSPCTGATPRTRSSSTCGTARGWAGSGGVRISTLLSCATGTRIWTRTPCSRSGSTIARAGGRTWSRSWTAPARSSRGRATAPTACPRATSSGPSPLRTSGPSGTVCCTRTWDAGRGGIPPDIGTVRIYMRTQLIVHMLLEMPMACSSPTILLGMDAKEPAASQRFRFRNVLWRATWPTMQESRP